MLLHKSVVHDARVQREARALVEAGNTVTIIHLPTDPATETPDRPPYALVSATTHRARKRLPHTARLGLEALNIAKRSVESAPDIVHAHDAAMLLPGWLSARRTGARLVYDSHELATGVPYRSWAWARTVEALEQLWAPKADATIAVSDGIAARLSDRYSLSHRTAVVRNMPDLPPPTAVKAPNLRRNFNVGDAPLILHQGAAAQNRGCATLLRAAAVIDGAHVLFLGATGPSIDQLRTLAADVGVGDRTHFMPPVPLDVLLAHTAQADVGVSLLEDCCENHRLALPNKLFEYVAAGIPTVVSALPEMARLVQDRRIGWSADPADPQSVARALRTALAKRDDANLRDRLRQAADELSWKQEKNALLAVYSRLSDD